MSNCRYLVRVAPRGALSALVAVGLLAVRPNLCAQNSATPPVDLSRTLARSAAYLDDYALRFSALVADEVYDMVSIPERPAHASQERLRSDLLLLAVEDGDWVQFRDVYQVNGRAVRDHEQRVLNILQRPGGNSMALLREIGAESARYNLGRVDRNFNTPTFALSYLTRARQRRSSFSLVGPVAVGGTSAIEIGFREQARPSAIQSTDRDTSTTGRFWVRTDTGAVLRTQLQCESAANGGPTATIDVVYATDPRLKILVPVRMDEAYVTAHEIDRGHATYSNIRQFSVDAHAIGGLGGRRQ